MTDKQPTAGIILAAGQSSRIDRPKQLIRFQGKYLLQWVIDAALPSHLAHTILLLGHDSEKIRRALGKKILEPRLQVVVNHAYHEGMSRSLQKGLLSVKERFPSVMFLLGDQPMVTTQMINLLLDRFWRSKKDICAPICSGKRGNPTIFSRKYYNRLLKIKGDIGARNVIEKRTSRVLYVEVADPLCFFDIDTEKDFDALRRMTQSLS